MIREIGGYFGFEELDGVERHSGCIGLSSGRNCLRYVIRKRNLKKIYLPYFLCSAMSEACKKEDVRIEYYHIDDDFKPIFNKELADDECLCVVNYYGVLDNEDLMQVKNDYGNIVIDNTHAFFQEPIKGVDTIYNCRKYFGVPDGAYLSTDLKIDTGLRFSKSADRVRHLIGRMENNAESYYDDFKMAEESFEREDVMLMSEFTKNLMRAIEYDGIIECRKRNMEYLDRSLGGANRLNLDIKSMDFMYPFYMNNAEKVRNALIRNKIYVPILWPNVLQCEEGSVEYKYAKNIIPIPIDQRYNIEDMRYVCELLKKEIDGKN